MTGSNPKPPVSRNDGKMTLRFWGVRGSLPSPGPATVRYGGNTLCVEVRCGPHLLILDAGSGLREFGCALIASGEPVNADILLSHTHLDHICGLPFFRPMYDPKASLRFWGGHLPPPSGIAAALRQSWRSPLMPDLDEAFRADLTFRDFAPGDTLALHAGALHAGPRVQTVALNHPGNSIGYRIEWAGSSVCYITDTEHPPHGFDQDVLQFATGTDILIYDASFTDEEYKSRVGWGHSTWRAAADLADAAAVKRLVLFHHEPDHDDDAMDAIAHAIAARRPGSLVATEGMCLTAEAAAA